MIDREFLKEIFLQSQIELNDEQAEKLDSYAQMLTEWNERINLTAITSAEDICVKHFLDSALPFRLWGKLKAGDRLLDVGAGAGFPSCVVKLVFGVGEMTLLDGLNKRIEFLKKLTEELGIGGRCIHGRAEELGKSVEFREKFQVVTARAVAALPQLCEYCLPFAEVGGTFLALKGPAGSAEAESAGKAIRVLGGKLSDVISYVLPGGDARTLIVIKKEAPTPGKYPRNKGQMVKKPL